MTATTRTPRQRWMKRWLLSAVSVAVVACSPAADTATETPAYTTGQVTQGDLTVSLSWTGTLTYADQTSLVYSSPSGGAATGPSGSGAVAASSGGTVTWLPEPGSVISSGGVLYRVDGEPVILLEGTAVLYRTLSAGDNGSDVKAVERALTKLGFDPNDYVDIDNQFRVSTTAMVKRFQDKKKQDETGVIDPASVVMHDGPVVVTETVAEVGERLSAGDEVVVIGDEDRIVTFDLAPDELTSVAVGDEVSVTLPQGGQAVAVITAIAAAPDVETGDYAVITTLPDADVVGDRWEVRVTHSKVIAEGAMLVDPQALVLLDDGSSAVRVVTDGDLEVVRVEIIGTSGRSTAVVSDDLAIGDIVVL